MIYDETFQAQLDYLDALFATEVQPGHRLASIVTLSRVLPPELEQPLYPLLAYDFDLFTERVAGASTAGSMQTNTFNIAIYTSRKFKASEADPVRRMKLDLRNLWNDRHGNGLGPVLRSDPTMNGTAITAIPSRVQIDAGRSANEESGVSGIVLCTFVAAAELHTY